MNEIWSSVLDEVALGADNARVQKLAVEHALTYDKSVEMLRTICPNENFNRGLARFVRLVFGLSPKAYWTKIYTETDVCSAKN